MLLDVEEIGRREVRVTLLVAGVDARHIDASLQHRRIAGRVDRAV